MKPDGVHAGDWVRRKDGLMFNQWGKFDDIRWNFVRVCAGPGEEVPNGHKVPDDRVWVYYGFFPCEEPLGLWEKATDDEVKALLRELEEKGHPCYTA